MGKGVGEIARLCQKQKVPCIGLAGALSDQEKADSPFTATHALAPGITTAEEAKSHGAAWLERLATKVATDLEFAP
jgi:glycerate kinase